MKILVTGANGFLGFYLIRHLLELKYTVIATGKGECRILFSTYENFVYIPMDFTDPFAVHDVFEKFRPEIVIHAGAMSKPDECEQNQWTAYIVNVEGTVTLLTNAAEQKSFFLFVSTDFIFNGMKGMYAEEDEPAPLNYYGKTKLDAEEAVREYEHDWAIIRTVLVYGKPVMSRSNLLTVVKEKLEKGEMYSVFDDQKRTPTYVEDLASGIEKVIEKRAKGIYNICGKDFMSPYEMAFKTATFLGLEKDLLKKINASDLLQPAKRPAITGLDITKATKELGYQPVSFEEGLRKTFS